VGKHTRIALPSKGSPLETAHSSARASTPMLNPPLTQRHTHAGFSGADLANLVNVAALQAAKTGAQSVDMSALEFARDRCAGGASRGSGVVQSARSCWCWWWVGGVGGYWGWGGVRLLLSSIWFETVQLG